jgi:hypothetical protein
VALTCIAKDAAAIGKSAAVVDEALTRARARARASPTTAANYYYIIWYFSR